MFKNLIKERKYHGNNYIKKKKTKDNVARWFDCSFTNMNG